MNVTLGIHGKSEKFDKHKFGGSGASWLFLKIMFCYNFIQITLIPLDDFFDGRSNGKKATLIMCSTRKFIVSSGKKQ